MAKISIQRKDVLFVVLVGAGYLVRPVAKRLVLPMGRGRQSLVFKIDFDFVPGAVKLVWNDGHEIHVCYDADVTTQVPGEGRACVDLGEIHQAAVVTADRQALVVSGRGLRSQKRLLSKQLGDFARLQSRCKAGSNRKRRLNKARRKQSTRAKRPICDVRHQGTRKVIDFCVENKVGHLYVGDPRGVRDLKSGRHHNQRIARWEMGKDITYLAYKAKRSGMVFPTGDERGTSSRCPSCGHRHKPKGREWRCKKCGFNRHRDVVGGTNMHVNGFGRPVTFPAIVTYRRAGPVRAARGMKNPVLAQASARRSRADTPQVPALSPGLLLVGGLKQAA